MDLAGLFLKTGVKNHRVALLLTDAQIPDERFLVIINDLLASGQNKTQLKIQCFNCVCEYTPCVIIATELSPYM